MLVKFEDDKINFIDSNDHFLGFDLVEKCCENFGWGVENAFTREVILSSQSFPEDTTDTHTLDGYVFPEDCYVGVEQNYLTYEEWEEEHGDSDEDWEPEGGVAVFAAVHPTKDPIYIKLYNHHSGYYAHLWTFKVGTEQTLTGEL